jgi:hypothetical protein
VAALQRAGERRAAGHHGDGACHEHRLDATENLLSQYGNVTIVETLG